MTLFFTTSYKLFHSITMCYYVFAKFYLKGIRISVLSEILPVQ